MTEENIKISGIFVIGGGINGCGIARDVHIHGAEILPRTEVTRAQRTGGRIAFAIPFETDFTLIGTADSDHPGVDTRHVDGRSAASGRRLLR